MLHGGEFNTLKEVSDWQKEQVAKDVKENIPYTAKEAVLSTVREHQEETVTTGELVLSKDGLVCGDFSVPLTDISELAMHGQRAIVFTAGKQYFELIPEKKSNAYKFFLYYLEWEKQQSKE